MCQRVESDLLARGSGRGGGEAQLRLGAALRGAFELPLHGLAQALGLALEVAVRLAQALARMHEAQAGAIDALGQAFEAPFERALQAWREHIQFTARSMPAGADELGRARRRGRAQVGGEVCDGEVGLVADAAHQRQRAGAHGTRERFVVERP